MKEESTPTDRVRIEKPVMLVQVIPCVARLLEYSKPQVSETIVWSLTLWISRSANRESAGRL